MSGQFTTITIAHCLIIAGVQMDVQDVEVKDRSEQTLASLIEKFENDLAEVVFFDIIKTKISGLNFASEPTNVEHKVVISPEAAKVRVDANREKVAHIIGEAIHEYQEQLEQAEETGQSAPGVFAAPKTIQ